MDEWMAQVLGSELLNGLEPAELQRFFRALVRAEVPAGCVVLEPGQASDRVYLVQRGMVEVCPGNQSRILGAGYFFGQDGLIRDQPRNARVTMLASGDVCSLSKAVFLELFHPLLLKPSHSPDLSCQQRVAIRVLSIDVPRQRLPDQARHSLCGPELLIPLCELRDRLGRLERRPLSRVQGGDWRSCELAVFLLREAGFRAELLVPGSSHAGTVRPSAQSRRASIDSARNTETG